MLAKNYKLPIRNFLLKKPKTFSRSVNFIIRMMPNVLSFGRFGVIISKKVASKATKRNQIKRIIFNFIKVNKIHLQPGRDILITVLPKADSLDKKEIEKNLKTELKKI